MKSLKQIQADAKKDCFDGIYWHCGNDAYMDGKNKYYQYQAEFLARIAAIYNRGIRMMGGEVRNGLRGEEDRRAKAIFDAKATKFENTMLARLRKDMDAFGADSIFQLESLSGRKLMNLQLN